MTEQGPYPKAEAPGILNRVGYQCTRCANCPDWVTWWQRPGLDKEPRWLHVEIVPCGDSIVRMFVRCGGLRDVGGHPKRLDNGAYIVSAYNRLTGAENDDAVRLLEQFDGEPQVSPFIDTPTEASYPFAVVTDPYEEIERPDHYRIEVDGAVFDVIDLIRALGLDFSAGNALKYLVRAGRKPGVDRVSDLRKAAYYLNRLADEREGDPF